MNDKEKYIKALKEHIREVEASDILPITKPILLIYQDDSIQAFRTGVSLSKDSTGGGSTEFPP
jgi:hypothetical protein